MELGVRYLPSNWVWPKNFWLGRISSKIAEKQQEFTRASKDKKLPTKTQRINGSCNAFIVRNEFY